MPTQSDVFAYLHELGISDIYASPIFHARSGSTHGYDIVDPNRLNPELGSERGIRRADRSRAPPRLGLDPGYRAQSHGLRRAKPYAHGRARKRRGSPFRDYFDIDWNHPYENLKAKILAPFLGGFYGECLENGEITLHYDQSG